MEKSLLPPSKTAELDQMIAETGGVLADLLASHRERVPVAESRELAVVGLTAYLLQLADEEGERGTEWIAQLLAVAINRLEQAS
jgi:hypothetical protein